VHTGGVWTPLTSFIGRAAAESELTRLLGICRLVTVTGPGGVGKTRLAAEVVRQTAGRFPDGVWFIELGAIVAAADVPAEVMSALDVPQDPGKPALDGLAEALAARRLLLVLDNCEHVLPAVAELCGVLLDRADDVRVLATSREPLGISGEKRYRLAPLDLPSPADSEPDALRSSAAAALFTERAHQADPRFVVRPADAPLINHVVTRLDGMPLAIELAAARVEALGLAGLADRIDDALRLLTSRGTMAADRHRSLAAVADWSYQLLTVAEQRVFRRLAVFPGAFTLDAAEAVVGPDAGPAVVRLVNCSLLVPPRTGADQRTRYTMLETLRAYGLDRLRDAGEEHEAAAALAAYASPRLERTLDPGQLRAAQERGAGMTAAAAAELAIMTTASAPGKACAPGKLLSSRERELVILVAQGHTNAQIAERLHISVRTVASHLDRIRDKTGHRRRADLTRLALEESLV
jgi:predicted ATPase